MSAHFSSILSEVTMLYYSICTHYTLSFLHRLMQLFRWEMKVMEYYTYVRRPINL